MAKGNPNIREHSFKKGDPRINRKGRPKSIPLLKELMTQVLGTTSNDLESTELAQVVSAMIKVAKDKGHPLQVQAAKEVFDRVYGKAPQAIEAKVETEIIFQETKTYANPKPKTK